MLRDSHRARARSAWARLDRAVVGAMLVAAASGCGGAEPGGAGPPPGRPDVPAATASLDGGDARARAGAPRPDTGAAAPAVDAGGVAVIRGEVSARDGRGVAGVRVAILDRPELGGTVTRADGRFDLAVDGGGFLTVAFQKDGFLPVHRRVKLPWRDWAWTDPVVLVPFDAAVGEIQAGVAAAQVARGSTVTDGDGARRATVVFPAATSATLTLPDGTAFALGTFHVRATEYTVGDRGPAAMPAPLPPSTAYTYAVELSLDEAVAAGARAVTLGRPVPVYVENFLDIPVGAQVPAGFYDRTRGTWVPWDDGRVIRILSTDGGVAAVDADGSGGDDDAAALGIGPDEARLLATLYAPGQTLWRVPVPHAGGWAFSFAYACLADEDGEYCAPPRTTPRLRRGPGQPGGDVERTIAIPIPARWPRTAIAFSYVVDVAGQRHAGQVRPREGTEVVVRWDGRDGYGRVVRGSAPVAVSVGWVYRPVLAAAAAGAGPSARTFANGTDRSSYQGFDRLGGDGVPSWAAWKGAFAPTPALPEGGLAEDVDVGPCGSGGHVGLAAGANGPLRRALPDPGVVRRRHRPECPEHAVVRRRPGRAPLTAPRDSPAGAPPTRSASGSTIRPSPSRTRAPPPRAP